MAIINERMREVLKLVLLLDQMDTPSITLLARDADILLAYQESKEILDQSQNEMIEIEIEKEK